MELSFCSGYGRFEVFVGVAFKIVKGVHFVVFELGGDKHVGEAVKDGAEGLVIDVID